MPEISRQVFVSELVRRDQESSCYGILPDETALQAMCSHFGIRPPGIRRPFAVISADDMRVKSVAHNGFGGQTTSYRRVPLFPQGSVAGQLPVAKVRHDGLAQRPIVVQLRRLKPNDVELTEAVATRLWEPVRIRRAGIVDALGFAATAAAAVGADVAMHANGVNTDLAVLASCGAAMAGAVTTLHLSEKLKPGIPQLPLEMQPPLRVVDPRAMQYAPYPSF